MTNAIYPSLTDRTVFITGGASGIGAAFVTAFREQGARVGFVDLKAADSATGSRVWSRRCDVTDTAQLQARIEEAASAIGPITVLINNVANDQRHEPADVDAGRWRHLMAVNLDHVFHASRAVAPMMAQAGGGAIVNLSSINAFLGPACMPAYVTAKAGIIGMTKALARDWGKDKIRVNAISPGWVVTERQLELWLTREAEAEWARLVALEGRIMPEDVARLALFLSSDEAQMITGQNFVIDAGRT
jgi:NAD(P)-dependent dehydrogenase (short-subunit alcohol dehydrogenase family)